MITKGARPLAIHCRKRSKIWYGTNDPRLMDTLIRIAKIGQLRKAEYSLRETRCQCA